MLLKNLPYYIVALFLVFTVSCENESTGTEPLEASFEVLSTDNGDNYRRFVNSTSGEYAQYVWNFGEGTSVLNEDSIEIFYADAGSYQVTLDVIKGQVISRDTQIVVIENDGLKVGFEIEQNNTSPYVYTFKNISANTAEDLVWSLDYAGTVDYDSESISLYCGFKATYKISLTGTVDGESITHTETFSIDNDDPSYFSDMELVFSDEFDGTELDDSKWTHETGGHGWGNSELQYYTDGDNTSVEDGKLKITAKKEYYSGKFYTSSRINGKEDFTYGRLEFSAKVPDYKAKGVWPAGWMLGTAIKQGTSWPLCGEIDIMEYVSRRPNYFFQTIHTESNNHSSGTQIGTGDLFLSDIEESYHVYGILWTPKSLKFYLDTPDNVQLTFNKTVGAGVSTWPFDKPFYFLFNQAVGGSFGGDVDDSALPSVFEIDYVRVYQNTQYQ